MSESDEGMGGWVDDRVSESVKCMHITKNCKTSVNCISFRKV